MSIVTENQTKLHRWIVWFLVKMIVKKIHIKKYVISGSYRRGKWWCNDIDLLIPIESVSEGEGIKAQLEKLGWKLRKSRFASKDIFSVQYVKRMGNGNTVLDLFLALPGTWGNALLFTTGPKEFNDDLREEIVSKGYSWSNPSYFTRIKTDERLSFTNEKAALAFLDKKWIKPSQRGSYARND